MTALGDNHCPLCRTALWAPDAEVIGSKECPRCRAELWVLAGADGPAFYLRQPGQSKTSFLAALAGVPAEEIEQALKHADDFDLVEFVMEIDDKLRSKPG